MQDIHLTVPFMLLLVACSSDSAKEVQLAPVVAASSRLNRFSNVPEFSSLDEAIEYATNVDNLLAYEGIILGSEEFGVVLPSGDTISNWNVNSFFRDVFRGFGEEAYPKLAPLLDHEFIFVQVGAYSVMNSAMYKNGLRRRMRDTREERVATMKAFQNILASSDNDSVK